MMLMGGLALVFFVSLFIVSVFFFPPPVGSPQFECTLADESDSFYDKYVNETWVESDEIEGYEDIPEERRDNLSEDAKQYLRDSASVDYTPVDHQNLSEKEKMMVREAVESDEPIIIDSNTSWSEYKDIVFNDVRYNNQTYECRDIREEDV